MLQAKAEIVENREAAPEHYKLVLYVPEIVGQPVPGQFLQIRCNQSYDPLLRRPFSIHRILESSCLEILYKVVGKGTESLRQRKPKEKLDILGPLGNGFGVAEDLESALLVAGGMGIAPLLALAEYLRKEKKKVIILMGAKTKDLLLCSEELKRLGCQVEHSSEDGSAGFRGMVTTLMEDFLSTLDSQPSTIYACGPRGMLKEVCRIAHKNNLPCQVSLEEYMACGVGACLGCPVRLKGPRSGYKMVCKEGPVFSGEEIVW